MRSTIIFLLLFKSVAIYAADDCTLEKVSFAHNEDPEAALRLNLAEIWEGIDPGITFRSCEEIFEECFQAKIALCKIKTKCIITGSVPIFLNNLSDFNMLVETRRAEDEASIGEVRVVEAHTRVVFYGNFQSTPFILSTLTKEARDKDLLTFEVSKKAMAYPTEINSKERAQNEAVLLVAEQKEKRARSAIVEFDVNPSQYFSTLEDSVKNSGLEIVVKNATSATEQISVVIEKIAKWKSEKSSRSYSGTEYGEQGSSAFEEESNSLEAFPDLATQLYRHYCLLHRIRVLNLSNNIERLNCAFGGYGELFRPDCDEFYIFSGYRFARSIIDNNVYVSRSQKYQNQDLTEVEERGSDFLKWQGNKKSSKRLCVDEGLTRTILSLSSQLNTDPDTLEEITNSSNRILSLIDNAAKRQ